MKRTARSVNNDRQPSKHIVQIGGLETMEDALLWVVRNQLGRRNLTPYMRAELALMGKEALMKAAFENQSAWWAKDGKIPGVPVLPNLAEPEPLNTREEVAKLAGVSHGTISKVEHIQKNAAPAVVEAVRKGEVSIDAAAQVATLPVEEQEALAAEGPQAIKRTAAEQRAKRKPAQEAANDDGLSEQLDALRDMLGEVSSEAKPSAENWRFDGRIARKSLCGLGLRFLLPADDETVRQALRAREQGL